MRFSTTSICRHVNEKYNTTVTSEISNLTYIGYFEHLLVIQGLLGFNDARKIDKLERIQCIANMEDSST